MLVRPCYKIGIIVILTVGFILIISNYKSCTPPETNVHFNNISSKTSIEPRTLVVYVYANSHAYAAHNLEFFIRTAVREVHNADYYFILQQKNKIPYNETQLPLLPSNAYYIQHENKCFDLGTIGWFLASGKVDRTKYKYFIFLNSSVRGPFIVSYYENLEWYKIFTRRLNNHTKLVGCTINCYIVPHVQSYLWALDFYGLNFLLENKRVFRCHRSKKDTILYSEVGASQILLRSGFGIDSLMKKYQGIDFRLSTNKNCNNRMDPTFSKFVDSISLDPFEVVFVKVKDQEKTFDDNRERAEVYEKWIN